MTRFIRSPHLPDSAVRMCVMAQGNPQIKEALRERGIEVLEVPKSPLLQESVAAHADMLLHHLGGEDIVMAAGMHSLEKNLRERGFNTTSSHIQGKRYPLDISLNSFVLNRVLFCYRDHTDSAILNHYSAIGYAVCTVKQGYAKCSTCIVDDKSIITADTGIYNAALQNGMHALLIQSGYIALPGCTYGFIGGCSVKLDRFTLAFCGDITTHPDFERIRLFCSARDVTVIPLCSGGLLDIGGIIPLAE